MRHSGIKYGSAKTLKRRIDDLPGGVDWKLVEVVPESGMPLNNAVLYYRDPVELVQFILSREKFKDLLEFKPRKVWDDSNKETRRYSEMWTGNWWWRTQVRRLIPILF